MKRPPAGHDWRVAMRRDAARARAAKRPRPPEYFRAGAYATRAELEAITAAAWGESGIHALATGDLGFVGLAGGWAPAPADRPAPKADRRTARARADLAEVEAEAARVEALEARRAAAEREAALEARKGGV